MFDFESKFSVKWLKIEYIIVLMFVRGNDLKMTFHKFYGCD